MSSDSVAGYFDCRVPPIDPLAGQLENFCRLKFTSDEDVIGLYIGSTADDMLNVGTLPEYRVQLSPDRPVIVGRAIGNFVPYLDPAYTSNSLVPGTGQNILAAGNLEKDGLVSRAHFMLRATAGGVMLVNGVPMVGGGLR
ncbi:MAG: hypothetical protein JSS02_14100, partial [Planctomycetes bacterium]|nr:hypothetical protein [Planctomycetota bacterium]